MRAYARALGGDREHRAGSRAQCKHACVRGAACRVRCMDIEPGCTCTVDIARGAIAATHLSCLVRVHVKGAGPCPVRTETPACSEALPSRYRSHCLWPCNQVAAMTVRELAGPRCNDIVICPQICDEMDDQVSCRSPWMQPTGPGRAAGLRLICSMSPMWGHVPRTACPRLPPASCPIMHGCD